MSKVFMPLANMDFAKVLNEAHANTTTGEQVLNKYRKVLLANESTCGLVNNFIREGRSYMYDNGVASVMETVCKVVEENKIGWQLASACEVVNNNSASYNYINRNASKQVEDLLEGKSEEEVVKYIKAGALKNIMFCEAFRNIVKSVYENAQTVITDEYAATKPISYIEENEGNTYFEVLGHIYKVNEDKIDEANSKEVSQDFLICSQLIESNLSKFEDDVLTVNVGNGVTYEIKEECCANDGSCADPEVKKIKCKRKAQKKDSVQENVFDSPEALREHNKLVVSSIAPARRREMDQLLEAVAKCFEHFDNFAICDNAQIVLTKNDKFVVIENKTNAFAMSLGSNHTNAWKVNTSITEALDFIKEKTHVDMKKDYVKNIEEAFNNRSEEEIKQLQESIEKDAIEARKKKVQELTEAYKDQPEKLAILSKVAAELQALG